MKQQKAKKRRPAPVKLEIQPGWNLGRHVTITIASDRPMAEFLKRMAVKTNQGGSE